MIRYLCLIGLLPLLLFSGGTLAEEAAAPVSIVASPSVHQSTIPLSTLRAIFGMRLHRWPDGTPVKVFVFKDDAPEHEAFAKGLLQVLPHQLRQSWDRLVFSGLGQYPEQVSSAQEMLTKVASTPGAVGYVMKDEVNEHVRILQIR